MFKQSGIIQSAQYAQSNQANLYTIQINQANQQGCSQTICACQNISNWLTQPPKKSSITLSSAHHFSLGDGVNVQLPSFAFWSIILGFYLLPIAMVLAGITTASLLSLNDQQALITMFFYIGISLLVIKYLPWSRYLENHLILKPLCTRSVE